MATPSADAAWRNVQIALGRTAQAFARSAHREAIGITQKAVTYQVGKAAQAGFVDAYETSALRLFAASMDATYKDLPDLVARKVINSIQAVERSTIGATEAQRRDNTDVAMVMERFAELVNDAVLDRYLEEFSGRSYREGDPDRRSGGIERFLRGDDPIAEALGHDVVMSLAKAVNDDDVPHIFRLNYGTESLVGGAKAGTAPPTFNVSMVPGAIGQTVTLAGQRSAGFPFPGREGGPVFRYRLAMGSQGQVQLYRSSDRPTGGGIIRSDQQRPSQGIAPSYFVEWGIADATRALPPEFKNLIDRWKRRVTRIR